MIAASQIGQSTKVSGAFVKQTASRRSARTTCVAQCSHRGQEDSLVAKTTKVAINAAVAAALMSAPQPAFANKITQLYNQSQAEESLFEKIIRERGDKLPEISIPKSAPAPKGEAKEEGEVYVPPKEVELVDTPLKLSAPVRSTTIAPLPRVPEPEPAKKAAVSEEAIVRITGGDLPAPPPAKPREAPREAPKLPFSFSAPKAEEVAPKPAAIPTPPPPPPAPVAETPKAEPAPPAEAPKPFGGFFSGPSIAPGDESKPAPAESSGQAGKPELPQQEPAVAPGTTITIPESKNIAPEPKVEAPKPATKEPAAPVPKPAEDENPFAIFGQSTAPAAPKQAPAVKAEPKQADPKQAQPASSAADTGLPVWVGVGGSIAVAVAAFAANAKNLTEVRAAEEPKEVEQPAEVTAETEKDLEPSTTKEKK
ncbi:hypothetical protein COCOBI_04-0780 [Coccomyxa sp. Obi]|nr:hypothetical protein COCOBI_04-0780 [Coccomyxa sp. Obi]